MVFDPVREEIITFGGSTHSGPTSDQTWRFKNGRWTQLQPAHVPASRSIPVLVFDQSLGVVVMYGGRDVPPSATAGMGGADFPNVPFAADTWTWDGSDWTEQHPAHHPVRFVPTATYDFAQNQVALLGFGRGGMETWTYDGNDWTKHELANTKPDPARYQTRMAFDAASKSVVAFGGFNQGGLDVSAVWKWDGQSWKQTPAIAPFNRITPLCAPELDRDSMLIYDNDYVSDQATTWRWDGSGFTQLQPVHHPKLLGVLSPDPSRHRVLLFGWTVPAWQLQVWSWSGSDWSRAGI